MKYSVLCRDLESADRVYDMLVSELSGDGCLCGQKLCVDDHPAVTDVMDFDLTSEEAESVRNLPGVIRVTPRIGTPTTSVINIRTQQGRVKAAEFNPSGTDFVPHSLFYHTNFELAYTHEDLVNGTRTITLSNIDCSNIDFVVLDSGIDITHPDFNDTNNVSRVKQFDWSQLRNSAPTSPYNINDPKIINTLPANYYRDTNGHGTAVASLAAGSRCGFAKNANIYSLRCVDVGDVTEGVSVEDALKLLLAFVRAKKLNLYGLSSSRPTIAVNSWGVTMPAFLPAANTATASFNNTIGGGRGPDNTHSISGVDDTINSYVRHCLDQGCHFVDAAGNENYYLDNTPQQCSVFLLSALNTRQTFFAINDNITSLYTKNQTITVAGSSFRVIDFYRMDYTQKSPGIGPTTLSKDLYPEITVGDIIPIGTSVSLSNTFGTGGTSRAAHRTLQLASTANIDQVVQRTNNHRYPTTRGPFFVKSTYSNFGPGVDVYGVGNACWAALSNQATTPLAYFARTSNERYQFFNGTSSACPVVAGILGTYLTEFPTATPKQAREWLLDSSIRGNIATTRRTDITINSYNHSTRTPEPLTMPFGPTSVTSINDYPEQRLAITGNSANYGNGENATLEDLSFCCRFFSSNNLVPQAYPLRKGIFNTTSTTFNRFNTTLRLSATSFLPRTHDLPLV